MTGRRGKSRELVCGRGSIGLLRIRVYMRGGSAGTTKPLKADEPFRNRPKLVCCLRRENRFTTEWKEMWFLGMDVGTGGTRAVVVDEKGKLISGASSEHAPFRTPHPGWAAQDPEDWWRAAQEAIRGALNA